MNLLKKTEHRGIMNPLYESIRIMKHCLPFVQLLPYHLSFTEKVNRTIKYLNKQNLFDCEKLEVNYKCSAKSKASLATASSKYCQDELQEAMKYCRESITLAPQSSKILSLAYAKCAEICLKMEQFVDCLKNIDLAEQHGFTYPNDSLRTKCIDLQRKSSNSELSSRSKLSMSLRQNKTMPSFAYCLEYVPGLGVRTSRDLKPGDVVAAEKPLMWRSMTPVDIICDYINCGKRSFVCIPCENCVTSSYCSEICRQNAFELYHKYECMLLNTCAMLVIRLLISAMNKFDHETLWKLVKGSKNKLNLTEVDLIGNYDWLMFRSFFQFKGCRAEGLPEDIDFCTDFIDAYVVQLTYVLGKLRPMLQIMDWNLLLGLLCSSDKHFLLVNKSGPAVSKLCIGRNNIVSSKITTQVDVVTIHGLLSLFNLSCTPNICMTMDENLTTFARVIQPIAKGNYLLADTEWSSSYDLLGQVLSPKYSNQLCRCVKCLSRVNAVVAKVNYH